MRFSSGKRQGRNTSDFMAFVPKNKANTWTTNSLGILIHVNSMHPAVPSAFNSIENTKTADLIYISDLFKMNRMFSVASNISPLFFIRFISRAFQVLSDYSFIQQQQQRKKINDFLWYKRSINTQWFEIGQQQLKSPHYIQQPVLMAFSNKSFQWNEIFNGFQIEGRLPNQKYQIASIL